MPKQPVTPEHHTGATPREVAASGAKILADVAAEPRSPGLAIISSKIEGAVGSPSVLTRPRLIGWLDQQRSARIVLVSAEAGYGKSTLLADFSLRTSSTCIWYRLETSDREWTTFLSYLVAAMREAVPGFGRPTEALLRHVAAMGPSREVVVAQFLSDLGSIGNADITLILDDYHLVEGSDDVGMIMGRLLERAPATMRFVMAGRGKPDLPLGRLAAQGRVSELSTGDLRFTRPEIEQLFETAYGQPLEASTCDVVENRTEGWAASLQLVSASIAASRPSEVGAFIEALSGAEGPIYDFLAEEVLARLSELTQQVLIQASLVDRVNPRLVTAALSVQPDAPGIDAVTACLEEAEGLGLLGSRGEARTGVRIHPLLRQFLEHQLTETTPDELIRAMHQAIARAIDGEDWLVAGKHFALAGHPDDAMRVLGSAASEALGTGAWGAAAEVIALMPDTSPPPAVEVIKARALIASGRSRAALGLLAGVTLDTLDHETQALVALTRAAALHFEGDAVSMASEVETVARGAGTPSPLREVALAWRQMLMANMGGCITDVVESLDQLGKDLASLGLHYYAGITLHNSANAELARGKYSRATSLAKVAIDKLGRTDDSDGIIASTKSISAAARAEMGCIEQALTEAEAAANDPSATADAIAEAAYLHAVTGRSHQARSLLARFERGDVRGSRELSARAQGCYARIAYALSVDSITAAREALADLTHIEAPDVDASSRAATIEAALALVEASDRRVELAAKAVSSASSQHAWRWMCRARIVEAAARGNGEDLALWIADAARESALAIPELADVIAGAVGILRPVPDEVEKSILQSPTRWMTALGRQVERGDGETARTAASLVARFGSLDDTTTLRKFDRRSNGKSRRRGFVTKLIRRVSPTVRVHDLGPTNYQVGDRSIALTETRRKAGSLLLYLVTRPGLVSTRDQVMESLWPDQTPKSAANSLHQTLFFLRRDIEPWYEDSTTADYVRMESDLVFLDNDLFQVDSVAFARQSADILASRSALTRGPEMLRLYKGRFAPEFEYEEWADDWRAHLHGIYLHLAHSTGSALIHRGLLGETIDVLTPVVAIDPLAFDLRAMLIGCLAAVGSADAAQAHYRNLASLHSRDLGVPARPYEAIVEELHRELNP